MDEQSLVYRQMCRGRFEVFRRLTVFSLALVSGGMLGGKRRGIPLKPSDALRLHRVAIREAAERFRSANPRVFGSVAHGADEEGSDLDILVDALPGATLFDLGALQVELEDLLGVSVDLLTPGDLPPKLRETILADSQPI